MDTIDNYSADLWILLSWFADGSSRLDERRMFRAWAREARAEAFRPLPNYR